MASNPLPDQRTLIRQGRIDWRELRVGAEVIYFAGYDQRERLRILGEPDSDTRTVPMLVLAGHGAGGTRNVSVNYLGTHYFAYAAPDEFQRGMEG